MKVSSADGQSGIHGGLSVAVLGQSATADPTTAAGSAAATATAAAAAAATAATATTAAAAFVAVVFSVAPPSARGVAVQIDAADVLVDAADGEQPT